MAITITSPDAVVELACNIGKGLKSVLVESEALDSKLKHLGISMQDEGFENVCCFVEISKSGIAAAMPDLEVLMNKLVEYADLLRQSHGVI